MTIVYAATNAVEAHMIVHLLQQSEIEAHIDGEHLQGAVGELPAATLLLKLLVREFTGPGCAPLCAVPQIATNAPWRLLIKTIT